MNVRFRRPRLDDVTRFTFPAGVVLILLAAGITLIFRIGSLPAGFLNAEAANALLARTVSGHGGNLLTQPADRSPLLAGLIALVGRPLGFDIFSARLAAALAGVATSVFTALWLRRVFGPVWGVIGGLILAGSFWFILFSRIALSPIAGALALSLFLWCMVEGLAFGLQPTALIWYGLAGVAAGAGYIADPTMRLLPVLLLIALISATHEHGVIIRHNQLVGLLLAILLTLTVAAPFIRHNIGDPTLLSFWTGTPGLPGAHVTSWSEALRSYGLALARLGWPVQASLGLNLPDSALFGPFILPWAIVGLVVALLHLRIRLVTTTLIGALVLLVPAAAITPVHPGRLLTLLPLLVVLPVAGIRHLYLQSPSTRYRIALIVLVVITLAGNVGWSSWRYFGDWAGQPETAVAFSASITDGLKAAAALPDTDPVFYSIYNYVEVRQYLAPRPISGLHPRIDFDGKQMLPIPANGGGYLLSPNATPTAPALLQALNLSRLAELSTGRYSVYRIDQRARNQLPLSVPTTDFTDGTRFLGHELKATERDKLSVVIAWQLPGDGAAHSMRVRLRPVGGVGQTQTVDVALPGDLLDRPYDLLRLVTLKAPASGTTADLSVELLDVNGAPLTAPGVDTDHYLFLNRYTFTH